MEVVKFLFSRSKLCDLQFDMHNKCACFLEHASGFLLHKDLCVNVCVPAMLLKLALHGFKFVGCVIAVCVFVHKCCILIVNV